MTTGTPAYPQVPVLGNLVLLSTAMATASQFDGTAVVGTSMGLLLTAGSEGTRLDSIQALFSAIAGATPSGVTAQSVLRAWANDPVGANTVAANNRFLGSVIIPSQNYASPTLLAQPVPIVLALNPGLSFIPPSWRVYVGLTVALGGTNCALSVSPVAANL
jgi:hypothetical protein